MSRYRSVDKCTSRISLPGHHSAVYTDFEGKYIGSLILLPFAFSIGFLGSRGQSASVAAETMLSLIGAEGKEGLRQPGGFLQDPDTFTGVIQH